MMLNHITIAPVRHFYQTKLLKVMKHVIISTLLLCVFTSAVNAQSKDSMYVQTDGRSYITGEHIWCSAWFGDAATPAGLYLYASLSDQAGNALLQVKLPLNDGRASGYIPLTDNLVSGIYRVSVFSAVKDMKSAATLVLIINPNRPPPPSKDSLQVEPYAIPILTSNVRIVPARQQYGKREKMSIDIDSGAPSIFTISIRRADPLEQFADSLFSSLKHHDIAEVIVPNDAWEGQKISARVYPVNGTTPAAGIQVYVSVMGSESRIAKSVSDAGGNLHFLLPLIYADAQLVFIPNRSSSGGYRVEFNPILASFPSNPKLPGLELPEYLAEAIRSRSIEAQAQNSFRAEEKTRLVISNPDTTDFYGKPDKRYMLDDYTRFPNMEEIITEFVTEVRIRKTDDAIELQSVNAPYKKFFELPALVMLDGIPVSDIRQLMEMDPLKLSSIDIVARKFFLGPNTFNGIIHYKSYQGNMAGFVLPDDAAVYSFEGIQLPTEFTTPDSSQILDESLPDFRNLLFWQPVVKTDQQGKKTIDLFTGDLTGTYYITIRGNSNGLPINGEAKIDVK